MVDGKAIGGIPLSISLQMTDVRKSYGDNHALKQFSYTMTPGVYGLLGPNGAGKSTLMNVLTDNILPDDGTIEFNGERVSKLGVDFLKVLGYMPQQQGIYEAFTAKRFLYYMAALKGMTKQEADEQIPHLLQLVNLANDGHRKLGNFSGGMKQRILIAQSLLGNPKILILDEPTAGLDPRERIRIRNLISEISFDKIVLIATHVVSDIEFIAKEILLLQKGELVGSGTPQTLTADMIGHVFEITAKQEQLAEISKQYKVCNISKDSDFLYLRIVSDERPVEYTYEEVRPTLEDVYLYRLDAGGVL